MDIIKSTSNKIAKQTRALNQKKEREKTRTFLVEGEKFVAEIPSSWQIDYIITQPSYNGAIPNACPHYIVSDSVFNGLSQVDTPQGIIAVVSQRNWQLHDITKHANPLVLICEDINDPGNLGSIIRIAHGLGFCGVILSKNCTDIYSPKVIRSTAGSIFHIPFVIADLAPAISSLKAKGIKIFAATKNAQKPLYSLNFKEPAAIIIGNEARGISQSTLSAADEKAAIPTKSESLNAATACGILAYEALRQRHIGN